MKDKIKSGDDTAIYEAEKEAKRPRLKKKDIEKALNIIVNGKKKDGYWCIFGGAEFRNPNKQALLNDLATVSGYALDD